MDDRFSAEAMIRAAASGAIPAPGDTLVRVQDGWIFGQPTGTIPDGSIGPSQITSLPFTKITGQIADGQVPASAVAQYIEQKQVELDWGPALYQKSRSFTVVDASVTPADQVSMWHSLDAPTGKDQDEGEMDTFICRCAAGTGEFTAYIDSLFGSVVDLFKYNYVVG